jgi:5-methylcytosine-specific restriction endonuclease McrA
LPLTEQHSYKGIRQEGESKQIYHRRYCKNNPKTISHLKARRYAREKGAKGSHTLNDWEMLKANNGYKCVICKEIKPLTKDHIIPLSEGGSDYIKNIQPLCRNCNSKKWKHIYENPELLDNKPE